MSKFKAIISFSVSVALPSLLLACSAETKSSYQDPNSEIIRLADTPIASVNGSNIYDTDLNRLAAEQGIVMAGEALPISDESYDMVLDELIDQRLLAQKAHIDDLDKTPEALRRLSVSRERILGNIVVEDHLARSVTEDEARKLYTAQMKLRQSGDEVRASHILVETKDEASKIATRLDKGESFTKIAFEESLDLGTNGDGGDLGYFQADAMSSDFSDVVFALKKDETSPPFETEFGWHIVKLVDRRAAPQLSFEQMREEILNFMTYDSIKVLLDELHAAAEIKVLVGGAPNNAQEALPAQAEDLMQTPAAE